MTGNGRSKFYELIAAGEVEIVKIGAMTLVHIDSLKKPIFEARPIGSQLNTPWSIATCKRSTSAIAIVMSEQASRPFTSRGSHAEVNG